MLLAGACLISSLPPTASAQSPALPATAPTDVHSTAPSSAVGSANGTAASPSAAAATPAPAETHRAKVIYSEGQLSVSADNSSLNQILRDVARQTGMKITGGVTEQRVFGKYGPGSPSDILAALIDGTGSNMLLRYGPSHVPVELVLSPRMGGIAPPSPDSPQFNDPSDDQESAPPSAGQRPQASTQPSTAQGPLASSYFFGSPEAATPSTESEPPVNAGTAHTEASPSTGNATYPPSPNGVRTPPQINQEQQQLPQ